MAEALLRAPVLPLTEARHLKGAGVYAIYYTGGFSAYHRLVAANSAIPFAVPIYVGKAIPKGARKGGLTFNSSEGAALRARLRKHSVSIQQSQNLDIADFHFRSLVVDDVWIPLGENVLIQILQPLWNRVIDGFGNNTPGIGRKGSKTSQWDTLHPGRTFVNKLMLAPNSLSVTEIAKRIDAFFEGQLSEDEKLPIEQES